MLGKNIKLGRTIGKNSKYKPQAATLVRIEKHLLGMFRNRVA